MRYYKLINDGYIIAVGTGNGGEEIAETEYSELLEVIGDKSTAESGYDYLLTEALTWERYEVPAIVESPEEEITLEDALSKLRELGVEI